MRNYGFDPMEELKYETACSFQVTNLYHYLKQVKIIFHTYYGKYIMYLVSKLCQDNFPWSEIAKHCTWEAKFTIQSTRNHLARCLRASIYLYVCFYSTGRDKVPKKDHKFYE